MSTEILTFSPEFHLTEEIAFNTLITEAESGKEKRRAKWNYPLRTLVARIEFESKENIDSIWNFYKARKGAYDTFWTKFPTEYKRIDETVGTGNGTTTEFNLDYFPIDTSSLKVRFNGTNQPTGWSGTNDLTNEVAKLVFTTAPGNGVVITSDYEYYFQVRFEDDKLTRELVAYQLLNLGLRLKEVRWTNYNPP